VATVAKGAEAIALKENSLGPFASTAVAVVAKAKDKLSSSGIYSY
jgi:hypothetical protein